MTELELLWALMELYGEYVTFLEETYNAPKGLSPSDLRYSTATRDCILATLTTLTVLLSQ